MRKLRNLTGMPVVCKRQKIGRLIQAELSADLRTLEGIWVDCGLRGTRYIAADHIGTIGEAAVITDQRGIRRRMSAKPLICRAVSTDGRRLGAIVGAEIDEVSMMVSALELSRGVWDDIYYGRTLITQYNAGENSSEAIVLDWQKNEKEEAF